MGKTFLHHRVFWVLREKWILPNDTFDIGFISFRISLTHSNRYYYYFSVSMDSRQPIDARDQWQIYYAHSMCISYSYDLHFDCQFGHIIHASNISRVYPIHTFLFGFFFRFIFQLFVRFPCRIWNRIHDLSHVHTYTPFLISLLKCHFTQRTSIFHHVPKSIFI